jgi:hypothetical protein
MRSSRAWSLRKTTTADRGYGVDPLAKGDPTVLDKSEIVAQKKSAVSTMPPGVLLCLMS